MTPRAIDAQMNRRYSKSATKLSSFTVGSCDGEKCVYSCYNTIRYDTIRYDTIRYDTIRYDTIRYDTIRYDTIRYDTIRYHTIPYHTIPYHTIPYHTIPYHTIPYHTIPYKSKFNHYLLSFYYLFFLFHLSTSVTLWLHVSAPSKQASRILLYAPINHQTPYRQ
jgi:hypothetical protein